MCDWWFIRWKFGDTSQTKHFCNLLKCYSMWFWQRFQEHISFLYLHKLLVSIIQLNTFFFHRDLFKVFVLVIWQICGCVVYVIDFVSKVKPLITKKQKKKNSVIHWALFMQWTWMITEVISLRSIGALHYSHLVLLLLYESQLY